MSGHLDRREPDSQAFIRPQRRTERRGERVLFIPGALPRERAAAIEETIWDLMRFASHLRSDQLGEFRVGTAVHRSESLALVQLLILYHMTTARATVALGGEPGGEERTPVSQGP